MDQNKLREIAGIVVENDSSADMAALIDSVSTYIGGMVLRSLKQSGTLGSVPDDVLMKDVAQLIDAEMNKLKNAVSANVRILVKRRGNGS